MKTEERSKTKRDDLIYPELSYAVVGALYSVFYELGGGHIEKVYQKAVAKVFREQGIQFFEQVPVDVSFHGENIGKQILDFVIEDKLVLELKQ